MNPKIERLMCAFCWLGTALFAALAVYLFHTARAVPEIGSIAYNGKLTLLLSAAWLAAALWFTANILRGKKQ